MKETLVQFNKLNIMTETTKTLKDFQKEIKNLNDAFIAYITYKYGETIFKR